MDSTINPGVQTPEFPPMANDHHQVSDSLLDWILLSQSGVID
jgi:hypothetical protein